MTISLQLFDNLYLLLQLSDGVVDRLTGREAPKTTGMGLMSVYSHDLI